MKTTQRSEIRIDNGANLNLTKSTPKSYEVPGTSSEPGCPVIEMS